MTIRFIFATMAISACIVSGAQAANLIQNGGFEDGSYGLNNSIPNDWSADAGYILNAGGFNKVVNYDAHSGSYALQFANYDAQGPAGISQTFNDVAGSTYNVSFYAFDGGHNGDVNAFLQASINGAVKTAFGDTVANYTQGTFTFVGTGSDTLKFAAQTNPSEWLLDDVSVTGSSVSSVPLPGSAPMFGAAIFALGTVGYGVKRKKAAAAA